MEIAVVLVLPQRYHQVRIVKIGKICLFWLTVGIRVAQFFSIFPTFSISPKSVRAIYRRVLFFLNILF